jgi:hypothetical protein
VSSSMTVGGRAATATGRVISEGRYPSARTHAPHGPPSEHPGGGPSAGGGSAPDNRNRGHGGPPLHRSMNMPRPGCGRRSDVRAWAVGSTVTNETFSPMPGQRASECLLFLATVCLVPGCRDLSADDSSADALPVDELDDHLPAPPSRLCIDPELPWSPPVARRRVATTPSSTTWTDIGRTGGAGVTGHSIKTIVTIL